MLFEQTIERLNELKLYGLSKSYTERCQRPDHKDISFEDFFGLLIEDEYLLMSDNYNYRSTTIKIPES